MVTQLNSSNSSKVMAKIVNKCLLKESNALLSMGTCLKWKKLGCFSMQGVKNLKKLSSEEVKVTMGLESGVMT